MDFLLTPMWIVIALGALVVAGGLAFLIYWLIGSDKHD